MGLALVWKASISIFLRGYSRFCLVFGSDRLNAVFLLPPSYYLPWILSSCGVLEMVCCRSYEVCTIIFWSSSLLLLSSTWKEFEKICFLLAFVSSTEFTPLTYFCCSSLLNVNENTDVSQSSLVLSSSIIRFLSPSSWPDVFKIIGPSK